MQGVSFIETLSLSRESSRVPSGSATRRLAASYGQAVLGTDRVQDAERRKRKGAPPSPLSLISLYRSEWRSIPVCVCLSLSTVYSRCRTGADSGRRAIDRRRAIKKLACIALPEVPSRCSWLAYRRLKTVCGKREEISKTGIPWCLGGPDFLVCSAGRPQLSLSAFVPRDRTGCEKVSMQKKETGTLAPISAQRAARTMGNPRTSAVSTTPNPGQHRAVTP